MIRVEQHKDGLNISNIVLLSFRWKDTDTNNVHFQLLLMNNNRKWQYAAQIKYREALHAIIKINNK